MFSALFSFLGGSVFRMLFGEISSFITKRQEHAQQVEMMRLQVELDDKAHQRQLENLRLQQELGVKTIEVQRDADMDRADAAAFSAAVAESMKPTGITFIDAWNGGVRPAFATLCLAIWALKLWKQGFVADDFDVGFLGTIVGFYFANRHMSKAGK